MTSYSLIVTKHQGYDTSCGKVMTINTTSIIDVCWEDSLIHTRYDTFKVSGPCLKELANYMLYSDEASSWMSTSAKEQLFIRENRND